MKLIPEGLGGYGCDPEYDEGCKGSDAPIGVVSLDMFWIDERETSVEKYDACAQAGACRAMSELPGPVSASAKDPITFVSVEDAEDYCAFAGGRLPADAEWERAARGVEGLRYPWGDAWCDTCCNWCDNAACDGSVDGFAAAAPVTEFTTGASPYGVFQLSGNVWEWTVGPDAEGATRAWLRGGGFQLMDGVGDESNPAIQYRATRRIAVPDETVGGPMFGFRCAADPVYE
ncbi:MAG: SUMF1/EgtB/PvdO family nonheme iron enzyme [Deltaproteobacteria bacterium]|nr:SUMF1/EgtB/PvdO family nonheme iron enzyme [Deltaproteobacteria bacterium]